MGPILGSPYLGKLPYISNPKALGLLQSLGQGIGTGLDLSERAGKVGSSKVRCKKLGFRV